MRGFLVRYQGPILLAGMAVAFSLSHMPGCGVAAAICAICLGVLQS